MKDKESSSMISDVDAHRAILKYIFEAYVLTDTISSNNKITLVAVPRYFFFSSRAGLRSSHHNLLLRHSPHTLSAGKNCLFSCAVNFITEKIWVKNNL